MTRTDTHTHTAFELVCKFKTVISISGIIDCNVMRTLGYESSISCWSVIHWIYYISWVQSSTEIV